MRVCSASPYKACKHKEVKRCYQIVEFSFVPLIEQKGVITNMIISAISSSLSFGFHTHHLYLKLKTVT